MIASMDQLTVVGRRGVAGELLQALQSLGVMQIDPLEPEDGLALVKLNLNDEQKEDADRWSAAFSRTENLLRNLEAGGVSAASRSEIPTELDGIEQYLSEVAERVDQVVAERADAADELEVIQTYLPVFLQLAPALAQLQGSRYLAGTAFLVAPEDLDEVRAALADALEGRFLLTSRPYGRDLLVVAVSLIKDRSDVRQILSRAGVSPLGLPARYGDLDTARVVHVMEERSQNLPSRLSMLEDDIRQLDEQHESKLQGILQLTGDLQARLDHLQSMLAGRYSFALRGWIPSSDTKRVVDSLTKQFGDAVTTAARPADEHHDEAVPVKLDNPSWVKPFEGLLALFSPPKYGSFDPSWTLAVFFPFFFGLVIGDIGFGLMFGALAWWMRRRGAAGKVISLGPLGIVIPARALAPISTVIFWCSAWSVAFGFAYGEFFGNFLEKFPAAKPIFYTTLHEPQGHGLIDILVFRVEQFDLLLPASLGFGVLQVLGGWAIRVIYGFRHNDMKHVYEGLGMFSGLLALTIFSAAFLTQNVNPIINALVIVGLAVFLICTVLARIPIMVVELISNAGNILSYLRLFAVGLSAALLANLATDVGFTIGGTLPIIGPILGILIGLVVHLLILALTIIGHTLQPLRLHYVEFFTKFGFYDESGRPYRPFRLLGGKG